MSAEVVQVGEETIVTETVEEVVEQIPPESTVPDEVHLTLDPEMPEEHGDIVAKPLEEVTEPAAETTDASAAEPVTETVTERAVEPVAAPAESQTVPEATPEATPAEGQVTMTTAKVEAEEKKDIPIEQTQGNLQQQD